MLQRKTRTWPCIARLMHFARSCSVRSSVALTCTSGSGHVSDGQATNRMQQEVFNRYVMCGLTALSSAAFFGLNFEVNIVLAHAPLEPRDDCHVPC